MCGIVGIVANRDVVPDLLDSLRRLEYRGYDSSGIATLDQGKLEVRRAPGKIQNLEKVLAEHPIHGTTGIAHTRWATHGKPTEANAHPHATAWVAVVHNGIIENYQTLKESLQQKGHIFASQTDTEVIAHQVSDFMQQGMDPETATRKTLDLLEGAFALVMIFPGHPGLMICAKRGSPMAIGFREGEIYVGSDALALAPLTKNICYLEEGDYGVIQGDKITLFDAAHKPVERPVQQTLLSGALMGKADYRHYMQKEIYEQPRVVGDVLQSYIQGHPHEVFLPLDHLDLKKASRITIIACGTSFYAAVIAKYWIEQWARIPVEIDIASEFRYRNSPVEKDGVFLFISQSGETADTLAAFVEAKARGQKTIAMVNVQESSLSRGADATLNIQAGPEIGVASTKAFMAQLTVLACFAIYMGRLKGTLSLDQSQPLIQSLLRLPKLLVETLKLDPILRRIAAQVAPQKDVLFIGRGICYGLALEGALKLKELSYIHAEAYAAGEMKHGPIALIDENMVVVAIAFSNDLFEKTVSNIQEIMARQGQIIFLSDALGQERFQMEALSRIEVPACEAFIQPMVGIVPLQLLAYHTAVLKGTDVDQPRNLAKSVTVE